MYTKYEVEMFLHHIFVYMHILSKYLIFLINQAYDAALTTDNDPTVNLLAVASSQNFNSSTISVSQLKQSVVN